MVAEGNGLAQEAGFGPVGVAGRGEVPFFVELPVVGQVGLGHHAENGSRLEYDRTVEEVSAEAQGRSDDADGGQVAGVVQEPGQAVEDPLQKRVLVQEIVDAVPTEPEFRKQGQDRSLRVAFPKDL